MGDAFKGLRLHNTLTRSKEDFVPIDPTNVRMYVCGPTVYDFAHIGNARPVIVFDVLYRLLRHLYGEDHVTYVRNITDVDDKINERALRDFGSEIAAGSMSLNAAIGKVTETTASQFHKDVAALGCLEPSFEPRATQHIEGMVAMIQTLLNRGHAYVASGKEGREALFDVRSMPAYGQLSRRNLDEQQAGARVDVKDHKRNPGDFVLWKESSAEEPGWDATFTISTENQQALRLNSNSIGIRGRPGWHIECSVMSRHHLGEVFDIHGGGLDLIFPHHENELAQSSCAHGTEAMANYWLHNGYLQVEGRKMSKSEGNFVTIHDLLHTDKFGGRKWPGAALKLAMLRTHYRSPVDWTFDKLKEAESELSGWSEYSWSQNDLARYRQDFSGRGLKPVPGVLDALRDDLNTPLAISRIHARRKRGGDDYASLSEILDSLVLLGIVDIDYLACYSRTFSSDTSITTLWGKEELVRDYRVAVSNMDEDGRLGAISALAELGIELVPQGGPGSVTLKDARGNVGESPVVAMISQRLSFLRDKNFAEADRIRDELAQQGIQLMDYKDPETGERKTKWEVKR